MNIIKKYWTFLVILLCSLLPISWFYGRFDHLINGVDTNFPLSPDLWFYRRLYVWNDINNAGSDFSSSTAGLFFHFIQYLPFKLGLSLTVVEIFSLCFWMSSILLGSYFLAKSYFKNDKGISLIFVCFYSFNTYIFNTWENVKVANLSLVAAIPWGLLSIRHEESKKIDYQKTIILSLLTAVLVSGTGINPAYFIVFLLITFIYFLVDLVVYWQERAYILKRYGVFLSIVVLLNTFWIFPSANFILNSISTTNSIQNLGFTNWLDSLSQNTSILNIIRVQGAWDWYAINQQTGLPLYLSYTLNYFHSVPFIIYSFLLPAFAIISMILRDKRYGNLYLFSGLLLILGVFLGVGSHEPTGSVHKYLTNHLPFFSLFRSPWYIFTPMLTLSYAFLIGLLFLQFKNKIQTVKYSKELWVIIVTVTLVSNLIYCYPLVTNKVFRATQSDSFFVKFPDFVLNLNSKLHNSSGRYLSYPPNEIESFNWGYRGIESILQLIVDREIMTSSINSASPFNTALVKYLYLTLQKDQLSIAHGIGNLLNISTIFVKDDQPSNSPKLSSFITDLPNQKIGSWNFYNFNDETQKVRAINNISLIKPFDLDSFWISGLLDNDRVVINNQDSITQNTEVRSLSNQVIVNAKNSLVSRINNNVTSENINTNYQTVDYTNIEYEFEISEKDEYEINIERFKVEDFGLTLNKPWVIQIDGKYIELFIKNVDDSYITFEPLEISAGKHKIILFVNPNNLIDQSTFDGVVPDDSITITRDNNVVITVDNKSKEELAYQIPIPNFDSKSFYIIKAKYQYIKGTPPLIVAFQTNEKGPLNRKAENLAVSPDWESFLMFFEPVIANSDLDIQLVVPPVKSLKSDPLGSKTSFSEIEMYKIFTNKIALIKNKQTSTNSAKASFKKISPVEYTGFVTNGDKPHVILLSENYSPFWGLELFTKDKQRVQYSPPHFTANYYANGWIVDSMPKEYYFRIYYYPQNYYLIGMVISISTFLGIIVFIIINYVQKKT